RCSLPILASITGPEYEMRHQEEDRRSIQSLLVFECWARFLCASAHELVDIPEQELMYLQERLPLNITHIPRRLLCQNDMLASKPSLTAVNGVPPDNAASVVEKVSSSLNMATSTAENVFHKSKQSQFHAGNARN
ncbi:hypothetical protein H4R20_006424, partial [Coemansia guatemalensis]